MEENLQNQNNVEEQNQDKEKKEQFVDEKNPQDIVANEQPKIENQKNQDFEKIEGDIKEFLEQSKSSNESIINNLKDTLLRFEAINETVSILPEIKEIIKTNSDSSTEHSMALESRIDKISTNLENISNMISEEKENLKNLITNFNEKNELLIGKMDSLLSNVAKFSENVMKVIEYEENLLKKREIEFALTQAKIYNERGLLLFYRGIFSSALNYFIKALELEKSSGDKSIP